MLDVRVGTGAAIFPSLTSASKEFPAVTRLHLTYAKKIYGGHQGARHFWRKCLPRLKYHNPGVRMTVQQTEDQTGPASLTIYFAERVGSTATAIAGKNQVADKHAPAPEASEKTAVVDVKNLTWEEIWSRVQASTGAEDVPVTPEDEAEQKKLQAISEKAVEDRKRIEAMRQAKRDQERMLAEARGEVEKLKAI
jgi:large subunit ribosomal protein MRP49